MPQPFWTDAVTEQSVADISNASLWDTCYLGGLQVPGIVRVEAEPGRKWDVKSAPGTDGATITDQGYEPAKPTITVQLWTADHWQQWQVLCAALAPKPGKAAKKPPAPTILVHPGCNALGVNAVIVTSVTTPKPGSVPQLFEATIKCIQWMTPKKAKIYTPNATLNIPTVAAVEPPAAPAKPSGSNAGP